MIFGVCKTRHRVNGKRVKGNTQLGAKCTSRRVHMLMLKYECGDADDLIHLRTWSISFFPTTFFPTFSSVNELRIY